MIIVVSESYGFGAVFIVCECLCLYDTFPILQLNRIAKKKNRHVVEADQT